jgi:hypothetical protein
MTRALPNGALWPRADGPFDLPLAVDRNRLLAGLSIVAFFNGISERVLERLKANELVYLILNTFEISAIIWLGMFSGLIFLLRSPPAPATNADLAVAAFACVMFLIPIAPLSVIALTVIALYCIMTATHGSTAQRGGRILLAVTAPLLWVRAVFSIFSGPILKFDAYFVSALIGATPVGNAIPYPDGSGYLWIAPACSSVTNVSLAIVCWVIFTQSFYRPRRIYEHLWCLFACVAVIAINVTRLTFIALHPEQEYLFHGPVGAAIANWTTLAAIIGICAIGVRHELSLRQ